MERKVGSSNLLFYSMLYQILMMKKIYFRGQLLKSFIERGFFSRGFFFLSLSPLL